jgi:hypothetical protein
MLKIDRMHVYLITDKKINDHLFNHHFGLMPGANGNSSAI